MYLGSDFHRYWARCGDLEKHPDDVPYVQDGHFLEGIRPCPFDGPLDRARVVLCLANPRYSEPRDVGVLNQLIMTMRSGEDPLPDAFDDFYRRVLGPINISQEKLRSIAAIFNICPYSSDSLQAAAIRNAAGLPSIWQAQRYLREVLIPRAQTGNIYLILIRKIQLWGVTDGARQSGNLRVLPRNAINGVMPSEVGREIQEWLLKKYPTLVT